MRAALLCIVLGFGCTYEIDDVKLEPKDLNLELVYAPCGASDAGAADARHD